MSSLQFISVVGIPVTAIRGDAETPDDLGRDLVETDEA
jgi:hypothetical protein